MASERDDGRVSAVHERSVDEGRFLAMLRALAAAQSHAAGLRSVAYGQSGSGGLRETTADERAIDAGAVGRGRVAWARVEATRGEAHAALSWLVGYAHTGDLRSLGALYAEHRAPLDLRAAVVEAEMRAHTARRALESARAELAEVAPRGTRRTTPAADALRRLVEGYRGQHDSAQAKVEAAVVARVAWGVAEMRRALAAWESASADAQAA